MTRRSWFWVVCCGALTLYGIHFNHTANALHESAPPQGTKPIVLAGGTIVTQTDEGTFEGIILIQNGKIKEISRAKKWTGDYEVIDITGCVVTPGLFDARSVMRLHPASAREGGRDGTLDILDAVDPFSDDWSDAAAQGITAVGVQPASSGTFGGLGAVLAVSPGHDASEWIIKKAAWLQASLGVGQGTANSLQRQAQFQQLRGQLDAAKTYSTSKPTQKDPVKEQLVRVLKGEIPLRVEAHFEDDLRRAMKLQEDFKIRLILEGVSEPRLTAETLRDRRLPILLGPFGTGSIWGASQRKKERGWPKSLLTDSSKWMLGSFGDRPQATTLLRAQAAVAVAQGLPADQVLKAITLYPAELLGVADRLGSLAPGRSADLAVFAGDPLDPSVPVRLTMAQGKITYQPANPLAAPKAKSSSTKATVSLPDPMPVKFVLKSNRILNEQGQFQPGALVIENGKIVSLTSRPAETAGYPIYDCGDGPITPGLFAAAFAPNLATEEADAHASHLRAVDEFDPEAEWVRAFRKQGFTHVVLTPPHKQVLSGQAGLIRLSAAPHVVQAALGQQFVFTGASRDANRFPSSLAGQIDLASESLLGRTMDWQLYVPESMRTKLNEQQKQSIQALLERKQTAFWVVDSQAESDAALRLSRAFRLRSLLIEPLEIRHAEWDAEPGSLGVILGPKQWLQAAHEWRAWLARCQWPIGYGMGTGQELRLMAGLSVQMGLTPEKALLGLTRGPDGLLGLPEGFGQWRPDGDADCVIWTGSPLDLQSKPQFVIVQGRLVEKP